ncbi:carbonic anhydrase [Pelagibacterium halotolerans]|uniref:carbonic anhydrase n=1 Tax=Pelagibacterium halotolerans TaxID=531813 RepID=UPI00384D4CA4
MKRRHFIKTLAVAGICPICAQAARASEGVHWSYGGDTGPEHWGDLDESYATCATGTQESPINITGAIDADIPQIAIDWKTGGTMVNNGHTIVINTPDGSTLTRGNKVYDLLQYHFHAPSEHLVDGQAYPMEAHFVHKDRGTGDLGVLGVFLKPGETNTAFASLAAAFPSEAGAQADVDMVDPNGLLPATLRYWNYEGSLTTPPCSEIVTWMVATDPLEVAAGDIERFTAIYSGNARPVLDTNRRFVLISS